MPITREQAKNVSVISGQLTHWAGQLNDAHASVQEKAQQDILSVETNGDPEASNSKSQDSSGGQGDGLGDREIQGDDEKQQKLND